MSGMRRGRVDGGGRSSGAKAEAAGRRNKKLDTPVAGEVPLVELDGTVNFEIIWEPFVPNDLRAWLPKQLLDLMIASVVSNDFDACMVERYTDGCLDSR